MSLIVNGFDTIKTGLIAQLNESIALHLEPDWRKPEPIQVNMDDASLLSDNIRSFTVPMIIGAGLLDSINPCAIATLIFFISMLTVSRVSSRGVAAMGISFCIASFITYTAIGMGLLYVIHSLSYFEKGRLIFESTLIAALFVLSFLSFRDAWRFHLTRQASAATLQLPDAIKLKIHEIIRKGIKTRNLIVGGLFIGCVDTVLESICTGQVYIPTLVATIKSTIHGGVAGSGNIIGRAWSYLLLYNFMFIIPLVLVFVLTLFRLKVERLIEWSKRRLVISKILLGLFGLFPGRKINSVLVRHRVFLRPTK